MSIGESGSIRSEFSFKRTAFILFRLITLVSGSTAKRISMGGNAERAAAPTGFCLGKEQKNGFGRKRMTTLSVGLILEAKAVASIREMPGTAVENDREACANGGGFWDPLE
jgi:hypothetical protein